MLAGKKILIGVSGSIAAYKTILLVRLLVKAGADVKLVLTPASKDFVSPLVLSTLSKNIVLTDLADGTSWANHVMLGRWADIMLIAPLSCNTLAKMANGFCDNLLMAVYLSATCPVVVAPAMDEDMWHHPATNKNIETIKNFGNKVITVNKGELASGLFGDGRMAEPEEIINYLEENYFREKVLQGKKVLVTAGPTYEPIDPVRFIGNQSSGKMGFAIAAQLYAKGAEVLLVAGPNTQHVKYSGIKYIAVQTAEEMYQVCIENFPSSDIAVMSAAVADYTPSVVATEKIKKKENELELNLVKTKDILASLGAIKKENQYLVGFALETNNEKANALDKLIRKNADAIVLNSLQDAGAVFGVDTNKITILTKAGKEINFEMKDKQKVAADIVEHIIQEKNG